MQVNYETNADHQADILLHNKSQPPCPIHSGTALRGLIHKNRHGIIKEYIYIWHIYVVLQKETFSFHGNN